MLIILLGVKRKADVGKARTDDYNDYGPGIKCTKF